MRPRSIEMFEKAYLGSIAVSLMAILIGWSRLSADYAVRMANMSESAREAILMVSAGLVIAVSLLLWFLVARKASNIAKWLLVLLTALGTFSMVNSVFEAALPKDLYFAVNITSTLLGLYSVWLLFRPDAVAWLDSKGADGPGDPATFE